jgi:predicted metal-dependent peptidase
MGLLQRQQFRDELAAHEPVPDPALVASAQELLRDGLLIVATSDAYVENRALSLMNDMVFTSAIDTMAVTAKPGTGVILAINPECVVNRLAGPNHEQNIAFGIGHEVFGHIMHKHLTVGYSGEAWDLAAECISNDGIMSVLRCGMPQVYVDPDDPSKGTEEFGVNPRKIWEKCKDDLRTQGKPTPSYDEFIATDVSCMSWLLKMSKLPQPPRRKGGKGWTCDHHGGSPLPLDQSEVDDTAGEVLDNVFRKAAVEGDKNAKDALERLHQTTKDSESAAKIWGDLGIGALYGEPVERRQVRFWEQWLRRQIGSRLVPGRRLEYNKRRVVIDQQLRRDPILTYSGKVRRKQVKVFADTSGSMSSEQLDWLRQHIGEEASIDLQYFCVDTELYPLEFGKPFMGRGGTDFRCVDKFLRSERHKPDAVIMVTDGHVGNESRIVPGGDPRKVVWLVTHDGDDWPARHVQPMSTFKLPPPGELN